MQGKWDLVRVHQFVRSYTQMLKDKHFLPHDNKAQAQGALILWLSWLLFNGGTQIAHAEIEGNTHYEKAQIAIANSVLGPAVCAIFTFLTKKYIDGGDLQS
mmetsp:Transcript_14549/g.24829  ORF Transcript_14549/g.24829 Transcript_14549/m.24829 type:complete len:101 (-) Transcript_14549:672-974(-)